MSRLSSRGLSLGTILDLGDFGGAPGLSLAANSASFDAAKDRLYRREGGSIYIGPGLWDIRCLLQPTISTSNVVNIFGAGREATILRGTAIDGIVTLDNSGPGGVAGNSTIRDLTIRTNSATAVGMVLHATSNSSGFGIISNVRIDAQLSSEARAIQFGGNARYYISDSEILFGAEGIRFASNTGVRAHLFNCDILCLGAGTNAEKIRGIFADPDVAFGSTPHLLMSGGQIRIVGSLTRVATAAPAVRGIDVTGDGIFTSKLFGVNIDVADFVGGVADDESTGVYWNDSNAASTMELHGCGVRAIVNNDSSAADTAQGVWANAANSVVRVLGGRVVAERSGASATLTDLRRVAGTLEVAGTDYASSSGTITMLRNYTRVVATGSLPAAGAVKDGTFIIEDVAAGDRNLILYAGGQRFRIDGGAAF